MENFNHFLNRKLLTESNSIFDIGVSVADILGYEDEDLQDEDFLRLGKSVFDKAKEIFEKCQASTDFGVQYVGPSIVFGGTNRLIYGVNGWSIDKGLCTSKFIHNWDQIKSNI